MLWSYQWIELIFGLSQVGYEAHEDDGIVSIGVIFAHGIPGDYRPLIILSTRNGTAKGLHSECCNNYLLLSFFLSRGN